MKATSSISFPLRSSDCNEPELQKCPLMTTNRREAFQPEELALLGSAFEEIWPAVGANWATSIQNAKQRRVRA